MEHWKRHNGTLGSSIWSWTMVALGAWAQASCNIRELSLEVDPGWKGWEGREKLVGMGLLFDHLVHMSHRLSLLSFYYILNNLIATYYKNGWEKVTF